MLAYIGWTFDPWGKGEGAESGHMAQGRFVPWIIIMEGEFLNEKKSARVYNYSHAAFLI